MSASRFDGFHDCVEDDAEDGVVNTHQCSTNSTKSDRSDGSSQTSLSDCHLLLRSARQGSFDDVQAILGRPGVDVNFIGRSRAFLDWAAIHIAAYFGHIKVLKLILKNGANINLQNGQGDTALHKAAFTGRLNIVLELQRCEADTRIINANGDRAIDITQSEDIMEALKAADRRLQLRDEQVLLRAAVDGDVDAIKELVSSSYPPDLHCCDSLGNTALHNAAYRGHADVIVLLYQYGVDTCVQNKDGKTAVQVACNSKIRSLLEVRPAKPSVKVPQRFDGILLKKSRFFGKQRCWVVLDQGVLSWFATRSDAVHRKKHLGFKHLADADIATSLDDCDSVKIQYADHTVHVWTVPTERTDDVDRQRWISALIQHRLHSTREVRTVRSSSQSSTDPEDLKPLGTIEVCFQNADAHRLVLERQLQEVKQLVHTAYGPSSTQGYHAEVFSRFNQLMSTSKDMCAALAGTVSMMRQQEEVRRVQLEEEQERSRLMEESLHALASEHHALEQSLGGPVRSDSLGDLRRSASNASLYYDAASDDEFFETRSRVSSRMDDDVASSIPKTMADSLGGLEAWQPDGYRTSLPCPAISRVEFSLWAFLKDCIGKDLSKITMPVVFNEPLSFTQRMAESLTYSYLLDRASVSDDPVLRMQYVAAFAVSHYACDVFRTGKPFNPLLGETYELEREDLGFRLLCEQVSHHPPVTAFHAESKNYRLHFSLQTKIKFWGKGVEVQPLGRLTLELLRHDEVYTWNFINSCAHNVIVGKLWVEHYGVMDIFNHTNKLKAHVNFKPCGWFGRDLHIVEGTIQSPTRETVCFLSGKWPEKLIALPPSAAGVLSTSASSQISREGTPTVLPNGIADTATCDSGTPSSSPRQFASSEPRPILKKVASLQDINQEGVRLLWQAAAMPPGYDEFYGMTNFSYCLNELLAGMERTIAPTDSRLRPDIRLLEEGKADESAAEKHRLEEKQRAARKLRERQKDQWIPRWFQESMNPYTEIREWVYSGGYWEREAFSTCPDIY